MNSVFVPRGAHRPESDFRSKPIANSGFSEPLANPRCFAVSGTL
jgi:hypothetical protein